ncbi:HalOD1 output domain-containing protein [Halobaculum halobium]|uniref:HalOD1 output domain-containing protein n=1 Tax=Halobaculum halobium TaxID=3032281 RepID=A0ABD5TDB3_9EURY|nr:HalOD1 output domain-containing protein [Halobaculum sp. SYNS20]
MNPDPAESVSVTHDPETGRYTATFDPDALDVSIAVVEATAAIRSEDPMRHAPLFEVVDPDALDQLCRRSGDANTLVEFTYLDHRIHVQADGRIAVVPLSGD